MKSSKSDAALQDIRKIVSGKASGSKKGQARAGKAVEDDDVLELTEVVADDLNGAEGRPGAAVLEQIDSSMRLVSSSKGHSGSVAEVKDFVQKLKRAKKPQQSGSDLASGGSCSTMEEVVVAILKPQLAEWLEKNLSSIVKEVVEREISKIMRDDD